MKHEYEALVGRICVPEELERRVLAAAGREMPAGGRKRTGWLLRAAVCGACSLVLVLGGAVLQRKGPAGQGENRPSPGLSEGLVAYAAEWGANGAVLLERVEGHPAEELDGTVQTLAITFENGETVTGKYRLGMETVQTCTNGDGTASAVPVLAGGGGGKGLYAEPEDAVWFRWPVAESSTVSLSAPYGRRVLMATSDPPQTIRTEFHSGIDVPAEEGSVISAAAAGTVLETGFDSVRGNYLIIDHGDGLTTLYGQCRELLARQGAHVAEGESIAAVGATGMATGPHLHFEVRQDGETRNPVAYFDSTVRDILSLG